MVNKFLFIKSEITLAEQIIYMKKQFPNFTYKWKRNIITWIGNLKPTHISTNYKIKIQYSNNGSPKIWITDPKLKARENDGKIPHIYSDNCLCLYLPGVWEWTRGMFIAETIIPWTSLWLYYYEIWLVTGEWFGGGIHPPANDK